MFKTLVILLALGISSNGFGAAVETAKLKTLRGTEIKVAVNVPVKLSGKTAAVVIAPGQGYHMELPIIKQLAENLAANGILVFRFNWNYYSADPQKGQPSEDLSKEIEDMQTVVSFAKSDARVDASQLILSGKSLGTLVSYQVFMKDSSVKALVLMTPVCTSNYDDHDQLLPTPIAVGPNNYPGLTSVNKPIVIALGNSDPLCSLPMLYDFLKDSKGNVSTIVTGGNHSWSVTKSTDPVASQRNDVNIAEGVRMVSHWINLILEK